MAYGDYINSATLLDNCDADTGDTPGKNADCRFIGQSEEATTAVANRPHLAIAENADILKAVLDDPKAIAEVYALSSFSGSTITINPLATGGSDVEFAVAGYLYVGNSNYSNNQESIDTLFQLTDDNYDQVLVDGAEVIIQSISPPGAVPGNGFYNTGVVTLTLSDTLPSGNYRLAYCRRATYPDFPDDVFIKTNIRGLHETAGEVGRQSAYVLDASATPDKPADFIGTSALTDALAAIHGGGGDCTLFLRKGDYDLTSGVATSLDGINIVGESSEPGSGTVLQLGPGTSFNLTGDYCSIENLALEVSGVQTGGETLICDGSYYNVQNISMANVGLTVLAKKSSFKNILCGGYDFGLSIDSASLCSFSNIQVDNSSSPSAAGKINITSSFSLSFDSVRASGSSGVNQKGLYLSGGNTKLTFSSCLFTGSGDEPGLSFVENNQMVVFQGCDFNGYVTPLDTGAVALYRCQVTFSDCRFYCLNTSSWIKDGPFVRMLIDTLVSSNTVTTPGVVMDNCTLIDSRNQGNDSTADPDEGTLTAPSTEWSVLQLQGVTGRNILFDRGAIAYNVEGSAWVTLTSCRFDKFSVYNSNASIAPVLYLTTSGSTGLIELLDECRITDIDYGEKYNGRATGVDNGLKRPIFYVKGTAYSGSSHDDNDLTTKVSGMKAWFDTTTAWRDNGPVLLYMNGAAHVDGLVWNERTRLTNATVDASDSLVYLDGTGNSLENFRIHCDLFGVASAGYGRIEKLIRLAANARHCIIRGGLMYVKPEPSPGTVVFDCFIHSAGGRYCTISENTFIFGGSPRSSGQRCIDGRTGLWFSKIVNNAINIEGDCTDFADMIDLEAAASGDHMDSGDTGFGSMVLGNVLWHTTGSGTAPAILPNDIAGYATNVLGYDDGV